MDFKGFLAEIKHFFTQLFNYQKTGSMLILHFSENDIFEFDKFYAPSFYNAGTSTVYVEGIKIEAGGIMEWVNLPFAISNTKINFKFENNGSQINDLVVSYGVLHTNNP